MGMNTSRLLLIGQVILLAGCGTIATTATTKRDYDRNADFAKYKTYAWVPSRTQAVSPATDQAIHTAVDKSLTTHGYAKTTGKTPDLYVTYHVTTTGQKPDAHYTDWTAGGGYYTGWPNNPETYRILSTAGEGALVVDLVERSRNALIWRGVSTDALRGKGKDDPAKATEAANVLMSMFPPPRTPAPAR